MADYTLNDMMLKYLYRHYPVRRIKYQGRFKRAIVLDKGDINFLSGINTNQSLKFKLWDILFTVFCAEDSDIEEVIQIYLDR